jgi:uncharacterized membrane protein (DUF485 family)
MSQTSEPSGQPVHHGSAQDASEQIDIHSEAFLAMLMRRQLTLSVTSAGVFVAALLGLPLLNYFAPEFMTKRVGGFTLSWLVLGVLFYPLVWAIAWVFIRRSIAMEEDEVRRSGGPRV